MLNKKVSALYVRADGHYPTLVEDWWDEKRDARLYRGPNPIVAHPPCESWGRLWKTTGRPKGADGGCFRAAIPNDLTNTPRKLIKSLTDTQPVSEHG